MIQQLITLSMIGLIFLLGLISYRKNMASSKNKYFFVFTIFLSFWLAFLFYESEVLNLDIARIILRLDYMFASFVVLFFFLFCLSFPEIDEKVEKNKFLIFTPSIFLFFSAATDLVITNIRFADSRLVYDMGALYYVYALYIVLYLGGGVLNLLFKFMKSSGRVRNQILYVCIGFFFSSMFVIVFDVFLQPLIKASPLVSRLSIWGMVFFVGLTAYAITKHELMDIRVVIGRSLAYSIAGALVVASFFVLNAFDLPRMWTMIANAALALFWAFAAHRLRDFVQTPIEEKWITGWYDPNKLINKISQKLVPVLEREVAFKVIADELKKGIKIKQVDIITDQAEMAVLIKDGLNKDNVLCLREKLYIPLASPQGVEGVLALGQKISEDPYTEKDLTLFRTVAIQTFAILDRIRPYEQIKKDFDANQKKLYDTERLLARSEKIASLANLIREYNHEIKTPLSIIRGETALLVKEPRDHTYLEWFKALVYEQVDRANDIVESTLRLSTPKERKETALNLNDTIESALKLFPLSGIHLEKELTPLPLIKGDQDDLQIVFVNLFKNAVEAMPKGGVIKINSFLSKNEEGTSVIVEIADTGIGIPTENLERIFEPFFSSHVTKGRGLGLSIVFRIIREHLGRIEVKSKQGKGTVFILSFPVQG